MKKWKKTHRFRKKRRSLSIIKIVINKTSFLKDPLKGLDPLRAYVDNQHDSLVARAEKDNLLIPEPIRDNIPEFPESEIYEELIDRFSYLGRPPTVGEVDKAFKILTERSIPRTNLPALGMEKTGFAMSRQMLDESFLIYMPED